MKEKLLEVGAKKIVDLHVKVAFHSPLMEGAKIKFEKYLYQKKCSEPKYELYQNVNGLAEKNVERIKKNIVEQLVKPVLWKQMMKNIKKMKWKNLLILVKEEC